MSNAIFYNDEHAARLLKHGPRYVNVYLYSPLNINVCGSAHGTRAIADRNVGSRSERDVPAYRVVVRLKPSVAE